MIPAPLYIILFLLSFELKNISIRVKGGVEEEVIFIQNVSEKLGFPNSVPELEAIVYYVFPSISKAF